MKKIAKILSDEYGVGLLAAPPVAVLWAADRIENTEEAKKELKAANAQRSRYGVMPAYPEYGTRLF